MASEHQVYTGIGSRVAPNFIGEVMSAFARKMSAAGWILRTGHTEGDEPFEWGASDKKGGIEVYLPWVNFNRADIGELASEESYAVAASAIPWWHNMNQAERDLAARAAHEMLGVSLDNPSRFMVCWTPDGATSLDELSPETGGCMWAICLATDLEIPVFNLAVKEHADYICNIAGLPSKMEYSANF